MILALRMNASGHPWIAGPRVETPAAEQDPRDLDAAPDHATDDASTPAGRERQDAAVGGEA
jgi:hypothetical protein